MSEEKMSDTLDIDECAEFLKINRTTALELAGAGTLPGAKIGRAWVFLEDELAEYLRAETRKQMRERQAKTITTAELEAAAARNPPTKITPPRSRGRERRPLPDLSGYDLLGCCRFGGHHLKLFEPARIVSD